MAAATNRRVFNEVLDLIFWGGDANEVEIAGNQGITVSRGFVNQVVSEGDVMEGPASVSLQGVRVGANFVSGDVVKIGEVIGGPAAADTNQTAIWHGKESGLATWSRQTLLGIVPTNFGLNFSRGAYATMSIGGVCRATDNTHDFDDILAVEKEIAALPTSPATLAGRLWKPTAVTYNAIPIFHAVDIAVQATADLLEDYGDTDVALTAVDIRRWNLTVTATIRDATEYVETNTDALFYMLDNPGQDLVITLEGVAAQATQELTIANVNWVDAGRAGSSDYTAGTLSGTCGFVNDDNSTVRTLFNADPDIAMIDFAAP